MTAILVLGALCTAGVVFYVRFFVALYKDGKRRDGKSSWLCRLLSVPSGDSAGYDLMSEAATSAEAPRRVLPFEKPALISYTSEGRWRLHRRAVALESDWEEMVRRNARLQQFKRKERSSW